MLAGNLIINSRAVKYMQARVLCYKHTSSTQGISRKLVLRLPFKSNVFSEGTGNSAIILLQRVKTP